MFASNFSVEEFSLEQESRTTTFQQNVSNIFTFVIASFAPSIFVFQITHDKVPMKLKQ